MKATIAAVLLLAPLLAQAETIDLYTTAGFGNLHQYRDVENSAGAAITIYLPQSSTQHGVYLYLDGAQYAAPNGGDVLTNTESGETVTITLHETSYRTQVNSGRSHMWATRWTLVDGTLDR